MKTIPLRSVKFDETRWRREFAEGELDKLAESILNLGLLHAPVFKNDNVTLIAGERRFRAVKQLATQGKQIRFNGQPVHLGHIPFTRMDDLSERAYKEAELHENIVRVDLSWQEKAYATAEIHKLWEEQAEEKGETHSKLDTAKEIVPDPDDQRLVNRSYNEVRQDLLVAAYIDDEEVDAAPTREDAIKVIRRKLEKAHREALAREFDLEKMKTPHRALNGDLFTILPKLPVHEIDCIIADPPYGIEADKFKNQSATAHTYSDEEEHANNVTACIAREGFRITKFKAHAYIFCDIERFRTVKKIFEAYDWYVWRTPFIWDKGPSVGVAPRPEHGPRRTYEAILYAIKNDRKVNAVFPDVLGEPHDKSVQFGAHKPPSLYANLIKRTCLPGDKVLDPCCGTGPIFVAAEATSTIATGIEIEEEAFGYCVARLRKMGGPPDDEVAGEDRKGEESG